MRPDLRHARPSAWHLLVPVLHQRELDWLDYGCVRAEATGIPPERVINARGAAGLASAARH